MNSRDRRALLVLLVWGTGVGLYVAGKALYGLRKDWRSAQAKLLQLDLQKQALNRVLEEGSKERAKHAGAFPKEWQALSPDQLRLKGQDGLLAAAQRSGLTGIRLRTESLEQAFLGRQLGWTLEGEGTLVQWVGAFEALEKTQVFMRVQGFHLELPGDPWQLGSQGNASGESGPLLKGAVTCAWIVGP